jgi:hypothetical protein
MSDTRLRADPESGLFYDAETGAKFTRRQAEAHFDDFLERRRLERQWGALWHRTLSRNERELGEGDVNISGRDGAVWQRWTSPLRGSDVQASSN